MEVTVAIMAAALSAASASLVIFRLSRSVTTWTPRQFALLWSGGVTIIVLLSFATGHVPTSTLVGEAARAGIIVFIVGTAFGLIMLSQSYSRGK